MQSLQKVTKQMKQSQKLVRKSFVSIKDYKVDADRNTMKITLTPIQEHKNTIIWLHGLGDSAQGFYPIFAQDISPVTINTKVILPTAPERPVTINGGYPCTSWYDIFSLDRNQSTDESQLYSTKDVEESFNSISDMLNKEIEILGGNSKNVYLGGFSQGGAMALYTGLQFEKPLGGVFSLSAYLFEKTEIKHENLNIGLIHGKEDEVVKFSYAWPSYKRLIENKNLNVKTSVEDYIGHTVSDNGLDSLAEWFSEFSVDNEQKF